MYSRAISLKNSILDYFKFDKHRSIRKELKKQNSNAYEDFFDYGAGYFYQSSNVLSINGLRDSKFRKQKIDIEKFTFGKRILDIGTNSGFLLLELNNNFQYALGIDYNPGLIKVANTAKNYLNIKNINFKTENFASNKINEKFDIVLSLANHHTFDEGISLTENYFKKIINLLNINGMLVLESHHPQIESLEKFMQYIDSLKIYFDIERIIKYKTDNFFDNGRSLAILKKINHL